MRFIKKALGIGALVLALAGCSNRIANRLKDYTLYVDLNGDKKQELISGDYVHRNSWDYADYVMYAKFPNSEGIYGKPKLIFRTNSKGLQDIKFTDLDGDGDLDLVFSKYVHRNNWDYADYLTFVARNDGTGNFGVPELISRKRNKTCLFY